MDWISFEKYAKEGHLEEYAVYNEDTGKWEITFDELVELIDNYLGEINGY